MSASRESVSLTKAAVLARIQEHEDYYKSLPKLSFVKHRTNEPVNLKRTHTAKTFTAKFFEKFNEEYLTMDKSQGIQDTKNSARRSAGDVFRCAYSYLGDKITLLDIIIECHKLIDDKQVGSNHCYQIDKRVYKERGQNNGQYYNPREYDEFGFTQAHYNLLKR